MIIPIRGCFLHILALHARHWNTEPRCQEGEKKMQAVFYPVSPHKTAEAVQSTRNLFHVLLVMSYGSSSLSSVSQDVSCFW